MNFKVAKTLNGSVSYESHMCRYVGRMSGWQGVLEITEDDILEMCFEIVVGPTSKSKHSVAWLKEVTSNWKVKDMFLYH